MTMKAKLALQISVAILFVLVWVSIPAFATEKKPPKHEPPKTMLEQQQDQYQKQLQSQGQIAKGGAANSVSQAVSDQTTNVELDNELNLANELNVANSAAGGEAINEGNELTVNTEYNDRRQAPDTVLVPNNNTATCIAAIGISGANTGGSFMLGIPMPEKFLFWETTVAACNYEQAADDAFAGGERELGWFWKCHQKTLYRPFRNKDVDKPQAIKDCTSNAVGHVTMVKTITQLRNTLETVNELREIERNKHKESLTLQRQLCEESNARVHDACQGK